MSKSYHEITNQLSTNLKAFRKEIPEALKGFSEMAHASTQEGALSKKHKELIALAIGVSTRCDGCIGFHAEALAKLGATKKEVVEALGMSVYMGGGPSLMYAADALQAFVEFSSPET